MQMMNAQLGLGQSRTAFGALLVVVHRNSVLLRFVPFVLELGSGFLVGCPHAGQLFAADAVSLGSPSSTKAQFACFACRTGAQRLVLRRWRVAERDPNPQFIIARSAIRHSSKGPTPFYAMVSPRRRLVFRACEKFEPTVRTQFLPRWSLEIRPGHDPFAKCSVHNPNGPIIRLRPRNC
jgi:hypothetical protein